VRQLTIHPPFILRVDDLTWAEAQNRFWRQFLYERKVKRRKSKIKGILRYLFKLRRYARWQTWTSGEFFLQDVGDNFSNEEDNLEEFHFRKMIQMIRLRAIQNAKRKVRATNRKFKRKHLTLRFHGVLRSFVKGVFKLPKFPLFLKHLIPYYRNFPFKWAVEVDEKNRRIRVYKKPDFTAPRKFLKSNFRSVNLKAYLKKVKDQVRYRVNTFFDARKTIERMEGPLHRARLSHIKRVLNLELFMHGLLKFKDKLQNVQLTKKELENIINHSTRKLSAFFSFHTVKRNIEYNDGKSLSAVRNHYPQMATRKRIYDFFSSTIKASVA
jgi:hypothetical protein